MKLNEETGFYENYGLNHEPFWHNYWFMVVAIILFIFVVLLAAYFLFKYTIFKKSEKKLTPKESLLQDMAEIEYKLNLENEILAHWYFVLTQSVKKFLAKEFDLPVQEKTASEIGVILQNKNVPLSKEWVELLKKIFSDADAIVFGAAVTSKEKIFELINQIKNMIESQRNLKE